MGNTVKSYNAKTGKAENKRVLQTFENKTSELVTVTTSDGQQVTATPEHQFYANNAWVSAENLRAGDVLVNVNGQKVIVEQVQHEILESPIKVYNFSVDGNHNYYVSESVNSSAVDFILVHNKCQKHHVVTKKILDEVGNNPNLQNIGRDQSSIFTALTDDAHVGYQDWHRDYDKKMMQRLIDHTDATIEQFQAKLQEFYDNPDIIAKFGNVIVKLLNKGVKK